MRFNLWVWKNPLEEGMATHSSILAWRIHELRGAWQAIVHGAAEPDRTELTEHRAHTDTLLSLFFSC